MTEFNINNLSEKKRLYLALAIISATLFMFFIQIFHEGQLGHFGLPIFRNDILAACKNCYYQGGFIALYISLGLGYGIHLLKNQQSKYQLFNWFTLRRHLIFTFISMTLSSLFFMAVVSDLNPVDILALTISLFGLFKINYILKTVLPWFFNSWLFKIHFHNYFIKGTYPENETLNKQELETKEHPKTKSKADNDIDIKTVVER